MTKITSYNFGDNYRVKANLFVVMKKIVIVEIVLALIAFLLNFFVFSGGALVVSTNNTIYMAVIFLCINIVLFIYLLVVWNYTYYIISSDGISLNSGVILRKKISIDIPAIRSISVKQTFFGRIFNYGTLILESPLLKESFFMHDLPAPFRHAKLIERARLNSINKLGAENVIIRS
jgi:uncharacterized membrane protein YdbT with pleckstrin-like domain